MVRMPLLNLMGRTALHLAHQNRDDKMLTRLLRLRLKTAEGGNVFGLRRGGLLIGRKQGRRRSSGHRFSERNCFIPKFILHAGVGESHRLTQSDDFFHTMGRYPMYSSETLGLGPSRAFF